MWKMHNIYINIYIYNSESNEIDTDDRYGILEGRVKRLFIIELSQGIVNVTPREITN